MKVRAWKQEVRRTIMIQDGPVIANDGDVVIVVIAKNWGEAREALTDVCIGSRQANET